MNMNVNLTNFVAKNDKVAVALSGGSDSMALLHFLLANSKTIGYEVLAINVEHGIRGESSIKDTNFVKDYCENNGVELLCYKVDCPKYAKENNLSIEQAGRKLRYEFFYNAIKENICNKVATAHHLKDNAESVLFNILRGSGLKGAVGIKENYCNQIIRPFLSVSKTEIEEYIKKNNIPFVTDESNFSLDYTRNFLRLKILPLIEEIFPEAEKSLFRFSEIARVEDEFLDKLALESIAIKENKITLPLTIEKAIFNRAIIIILKMLGIEKDWEKTHIDIAFNLIRLQNGAKANLKNGVVAVREYDCLAFYKEESKLLEIVPFALGEIMFGNSKLLIENSNEQNLKNGFYGDLNKIPNGAVIRTRQDGDIFEKFGGGTKKLNDYFTDVKIPQLERDQVPLLAHENQILAIFGVAISNKIKVDETTKNIIKFTREKNNG